MVELRLKGLALNHCLRSGAERLNLRGCDTHHNTRRACKRMLFLTKEAAAIQTFVSFNTLDFRFQISGFRFRISDFRCRFHISDFRFQISNFRFEISDFRFQIPDFIFGISDLGLQISDFTF